MTTPEYKEIFTRNLNLFLETCNQFAAKVVNAGWDGWASYLVLIICFIFGVIGAVHLKGLSDSYFETQDLRMSMCKSAGYIYVDHSDTTITCLDGAGDVVHIKTDIVKSASRSVSVSKVPVSQQ